MNIKEIIDAIRETVSMCNRNILEVDLMAALVTESESWKMRLQELEDKDDHE